MQPNRTATQIREEFLAFFREKDHTITPSSSIVPHNDPTLLFINAGMNQFKDVFLGRGERSYRRVANSQKCLRVSGKHNDLEEVGRDTYHHTFFEMLGNWSFGDYFKEEAIAWAWELLVDRWGIDPDRLYASVHAGDPSLGLEEDHEARGIWEKYLPAHRVLRGSTKDNFWMMGDTGPCGPCSEVHIDWRTTEERQRVPGSTLVNQDDPRVIELWNLVFIQYNAHSDGTLELLADKHVDTGMGLERLVAVLQGKNSNYDTDIFIPLLQQIAALSPLEAVHSYDDIRCEKNREQIRVAIRVVADHIRAITFAVCDGASPGNVGRGYVVRRILRRAARYGYQVLGFREPFLFELVETLVVLLGAQFPELSVNRKRIERTIKAEEQSFLQTLGKGMAFFEFLLPYLQDPDKDVKQNARAMDLLKKAGMEADAFAQCIRRQQVPGEVAFLLHDTYGFPVDLTQLMAREQGLRVDREQYDRCMTVQRERARKKIYINENLQTTDHFNLGHLKRFRDGEHSVFKGYDRTMLKEATIHFMQEHKPYAIVLDSTPFYAESGGQVGDTGWLHIGDQKLIVLNTKKNVFDTKKPKKFIPHIVDRLPETHDAPVHAVVDAERRARITRHHTATHLFHAALREILGPHVEQKGSLVAPDHLRFDFSHYQRVSPKELQQVQERVNEAIQRNIQAEIEDNVPLEEALSRGAMALFGEQYGDTVRVVTFDPDYSLELCGGTHVQATGEIGLFLLRSEGSIAAGIRRVEAMTGTNAVTVMQRELNELGRVRGYFRGQQHVDEAVADLLSKARRLEKEVEKLRRDNLVRDLDALIHKAQKVGSLQLVVGAMKEGTPGKMLREVATILRKRLGSNSVGLLGSTDTKAGKVYLTAMVSDDLVDKGLKAGAIVQQLARYIGGGGGGRPELATAGGNKPEGLQHALRETVDLVRQMQP